MLEFLLLISLAILQVLSNPNFPPTSYELAYKDTVNPQDFHLWRNVLNYRFDDITGQEYCTQGGKNNFVVPSQLFQNKTNMCRVDCYSGSCCEKYDKNCTDSSVCSCDPNRLADLVLFNLFEYLTNSSSLGICENDLHNQSTLYYYNRTLDATHRYDYFYCFNNDAPVYSKTVSVTLSNTTDQYVTLAYYDFYFYSVGDINVTFFEGNNTLCHFDQCKVNTKSLIIVFSVIGGVTVLLVVIGYLMWLIKYLRRPGYQSLESVS